MRTSRGIPAMLLLPRPPHGTSSLTPRNHPDPTPHTTRALYPGTLACGNRRANMPSKGRILSGICRAGVEELLQQGRHGLSVLFPPRPLQPRHEAVPGQRPVDAGQSIGQVQGSQQVLARPVARPRLQVCIAKGPELGRILFQPEADLRAHQYRAQRVERVRDAAVAPVDKDGASVADENVAIVEVTVV